MTAPVRAWLLLALFLCAGTSLPSLDALLYHQHADPMAGRVHVEPAGGCTSHADHCTLRRTPPGSRAVMPLVLVARLATDLQVAPSLFPPAPGLAPHAASLPRSRAPPVPVA
jgi:hypothetical protein